jgi:hypothetical protein
LWRDQVRIALSPDRVALARVSGGWRRKVIAKHAVNFPELRPYDWRSCIEALQAVLQETAWQDADAFVVISNHFVRYALVPWSEHLATDDEKRAWVAHQFVELYGEGADGAEYRWSEDKPNAPCVASAVNSEFMRESRACFESSSLRLRSIQPYLMAAFNRCKHHVKGASAWIVLPETGRVCLAAVAAGEWRTVTSKSMGADWEAELSLLLERQFLLAEDEAPAIVLAYAPEVPSLALSFESDVPLKVVAPRALAGYSPQVDSEYSMALVGVA